MYFFFWWICVCWALSSILLLLLPFCIIIKGRLGFFVHYVVFNHFKDISLEFFQLWGRFRAHTLNKTPLKHQLGFKMCLGRGGKKCIAWAEPWGQHDSGWLAFPGQLQTLCLILYLWPGILIKVCRGSVGDLHKSEKNQHRRNHSSFVRAQAKAEWDSLGCSNPGMAALLVGWSRLPGM